MPRVLVESVFGMEVLVGGAGGVGSMRMHGAASVGVCGFSGGVGGVGGIVFLATRGSFGGGSGAQDIARDNEIPLPVSKENRLEYVDRAIHGSPKNLVIHNKAA